ncbi:MAG: hypothetical protein KDD73_02685 [Anaerolineales bacterium]|nr:hypothetical protein [Anaerolineales bacterium]MCB9127762.1 hypothetical protein [Ardenticatenales bacterium]
MSRRRSGRRRGSASQSRSPLNVYTNHQKIKRYQSIGMRLALAGVVLLIISAVLLFAVQNEMLAWIPLMLGVLVSGAGTYFINRWGREPLPEKRLPDALSFLGSWGVLLNHYGPVPHLLLTKRGLTILHSKQYEGEVRYDPKKSRWGSKFSLRRFYGQGMTAETVGNPTQEAEQLEAKVRAWLVDKVGADAPARIPVETILLFMPPKTTFAFDEAPIPVATPETIADRVKELYAKHSNLPRDLYSELRAALEAEVPASDHVDQAAE